MSILEDIGLSQVEIKVFLIILELGESKAGKIIDGCGLQSSSVYHAIHSLIKKGFVSYIKKSQIKYYKTADPEAILDYIESKKKEYMEILPELKARQKKSEDEGVEFFKSYKGIKTMILSLFKDSKKGDVFRSFAIEEPTDYEVARKKVFKSIKTITKEKEIIPMGIFHESTRYKPKKNSIVKKRYINTPMPPNTIIFGNKVAIISWKGEPSGTLIHSKDIAHKYAEFFDHTWKIAKK